MNRRTVETAAAVVAVLYMIVAFLFWVYEIMTIGRH